MKTGLSVGPGRASFSRARPKQPKREPRCSTFARRLKPASNGVICGSSLSRKLPMPRDGPLSRDAISASRSSKILFEVKIGQVHVAAGHDVDSKNIPSHAKANLEKL
jgi:hypothetical protein